MVRAMAHHGEATSVIETSPDDVFATITDLEHLTDWNAALRTVREIPAELGPGAQWVVDIHATGFGTWASRSEVVKVDRERRVFEYRSRTDDGNPSFADWRWTVEADRSGARVTVTYDLNPRTFFRRHLIVRLRKPVLAKEVRASLAVLGSAVRVR